MSLFFPEKRKGATKLTNMRISEVSGVDSGANLCDGWVLVKSRTIGDGRLDDGGASVAPSQATELDTQLVKMVAEQLATSGKLHRRYNKALEEADDALPEVPSSYDMLAGEHPTSPMVILRQSHLEADESHFLPHPEMAARVGQNVHLLEGTGSPRVVGQVSHASSVSGVIVRHPSVAIREAVTGSHLSRIGSKLYLHGDPPADDA
jgi:hypothetical protein